MKFISFEAITIFTARKSRREINGTDRIIEDNFGNVEVEVTDPFTGDCYKEVRHISAMSVPDDEGTELMFYEDIDCTEKIDPNGLSMDDLAFVATTIERRTLELLQQK